MLKRKCQNEGDVPFAIDVLFGSSGIEMSDRLSIDHINESIHNLQTITNGNSGDQSQFRQVINFDDQYA